MSGIKKYWKQTLGIFLILTTLLFILMYFYRMVI
jgi:hypothetical protein